MDIISKSLEHIKKVGYFSFYEIDEIAKKYNPIYQSKEKRRELTRKLSKIVINSLIP